MNTTQLAQPQLFYTGVAGYLPGNTLMWQTAPWDSGADIDVHDMLFKFSEDLEIAESLDIALRVLTDVYRLPKGLQELIARGRQIRRVSPWGTYISTYVWARDTMDDGVIHVYMYDGDFVIELPDESLWDDSGLGWLTAYRPCCNWNKANLTPWLGPDCGCTRC
jgi:hypothetical protein